MTKNNPFRVCNSILRQELLLLLFLRFSWIREFVSILTDLKLFKHFRFPILFAIFLRVDHHVHSITLVFNFASGHKIRANRILLWQICSEVHFLPLKHFFKIVCAREPKLSKMPTFYEIKLSV